MTNTQRDVLKYRLDLVMRNLRTQHSGADVHEVGNMLNSATMIMEVINEDLETLDIIEARVKKIEGQQVAFFKRKFDIY